MYLKSKVIKSDWLYREVVSQAGYKIGYTDPDKDINRTVEILAPMLFYETLDVKQASKEEDIEKGIDVYVKNESVQVKCTAIENLYLEDYSNNHCGCWDHCEAKVFLRCYVDQNKPGEVLVEEYLVSEIKRLLIELRRKHKAFPDGYNGKKSYWGTDPAFGYAYYCEKGDSGYFKMYRH